MKTKALVEVIFGLAMCQTAVAQSPKYTMEDCRNSSQIFFQGFESRSEMKYQGAAHGRHACRGRDDLPGESPGVPSVLLQGGARHDGRLLHRRPVLVSLRPR